VAASALVRDLKLSRPVAVRKTDPSTELEYLRAAQRPSGAFLRRPNEPEIIPYWGNYATIGIAATLGAKPGIAPQGWNWLNWYAAHQDATTGYVQDHTLINDVEVATGHHDSTDAYAGTFLIAAEAMYEATRCTECLKPLRHAIALAVTAIASTQDVDGLTWAQPVGRVKYLMDQAEVAAGLRSAERLAGVLNDPALAAKALNMRQRHDRGLLTMVDRPDGQMTWAIAENEEVARRFDLPGAVALVNVERLYPDALGPVFFAALASDIAPTVATAAVTEYTTRWHRWTEDPDVWGFPVLVAWALDRAGQQAAAQAGAAELHDVIVAGYRGKALTVGHVGQLLVIVA
jgi:hypothetical protein